MSQQNVLFHFVVLSYVPQQSFYCCIMILYLRGRELRENSYSQL